MVPFPPSLLFPDFKVNTVPISVTATPQLLIKPSPDRFSFWVWQSSSSVIFIGPTKDVNGTTGLPISNNSVSRALTFIEFGPAVGMGWYVVATAPLNTFYTEVIYQPRKVGD